MKKAESNIHLSSVCLPSEDIVAREIEGDMIIVPLVAGIGDSDDELYTLNETGKAIWQKLDGDRALTDVLSLLEQEFQWEPAEIESDLLGFVTEMTRRNILTVK